MDNWIQAIYDATGIPLKEEDLSLAFREGQWWLVLYRYPILPIGTRPDPNEAVTSSTRTALAQGMEQRLSETIPQVQHLIKTLGKEQARFVAVAVVNAEERVSPYLDSTETERGWPHFLLRLSAGSFDVEIDMNPYVPEEPLDLDEVQRQANVILQVVRSAPSAF